jgi:predicted transcriptional regulator
MEASALPDNLNDPLLLDLTVQTVSAHVGHNSVSVDALPPLIVSVLTALKEAGSGKDAAKQDPAVPINESAVRDHIIVLNVAQPSRR